MFWDIFYALCMENGTTPNAVCKKLNLSNATATHWKNGTMPKGDVLSSIADCFNCSVDYLLGRTDSPEISQNYSNNSISNSNNVAIASGDANNITISNGNQKSEKDKEDMELMELIKSLPLKKRVKIISMIYEEIEEK